MTTSRFETVASYITFAVWKITEECDLEAVLKPEINRLCQDHGQRQEKLACYGRARDVLVNSGKKCKIKKHKSKNNATMACCELGLAHINVKDLRLMGRA